MKFYIETYGCQMNAHDSEKLAGILLDLGHTAANEPLEADILLFNTCCVRKHAEERVYGNVGALKARKDDNPSLIIGVCGCMMQQEGEAKKLLLRYPFVNFAIGTNKAHLLPEIIKRAQKGERSLFAQDNSNEIIEGLPIIRSKGVSASINIMYGCNNYCSYCIVPYVRGHERSRSAQNIIDEARGLVKEGYTEIMLLGQNVNSFGAGEQMSFSALLNEISLIEGLKRIRFMTSHPKDLSDELIQTMAQRENICEHIHLPVQSGSDKILELMNRKYTRSHYLSLIKKLRAANPNMEITTDIIVGFPGESEEDFLDTLALVDEAGFSAAFTFMYSKRKGTKAAEMKNQLTLQEKKSRLARLNALQKQNTAKTNERHIGSVGEVLIEGCDYRTNTPLLFGKLSCLKSVYFEGESNRVGEYANVLIEKTKGGSLLGKEVK